MEREEFKKKLIYEKIFEEVKDQFEINTTSHLRYYIIKNNYELDNDSIKNLYVKITNYRIDKYGTSIVFKRFPKERKYILWDTYLQKYMNKENR